MGEHVRRLNHTQKFLEDNKVCIFCGGVATTIDHVPPKITFRNKQWPETFEFAACKACNAGTRHDDQLVAFLARMGDRKELSYLEQEEVNRLIKAVQINHPEIALKMMEMSTNAKRRVARETGIEPAPGETFSDLPLIHLPDEVSHSVGRVAAKITKALYYKHTGMFLPSKVGIGFRWFTNVQAMAGKSPLVPEIMQIAKLKGELIRNNKVLNDQFDYQYQISNDHSIGVFVCVFGTSFGFLSFLTLNPDIIQNILQSMKNPDGSVRSVFELIEWPPT